MLEKRTLGSSDIEVSLLGLGGNTFGPPRIDYEMTEKVIHAALDAGITFLDTATGYTGGVSEQFIGDALKGKRDRAVIGTKFNFNKVEPGGGAARVREHCELSLQRLKTDHIDLLQIHMPSDVLSTAELLTVLNELVTEGKIRAYGASNYSGWRLAESEFTAKQMGVSNFVSVQNHYSLLYRRAEQEQLQACKRYGISFIPYHPIAGGFLSGKYAKGQPAPEGSRGAEGSPIIAKVTTEQNWEVISDLDTWAKDHGHSLLELAIAWLASQPIVGAVITGVSNVQQMEQNLAGAQWQLTAEQVAEVAALSDLGQNAPTENYLAQIRQPTAREKADRAAQ